MQILYVFGICIDIDILRQKHKLEMLPPFLFYKNVQDENDIKDVFFIYLYTYKYFVM